MQLTLWRSLHLVIPPSGNKRSRPRRRTFCRQPENRLTQLTLWPDQPAAQTGDPANETVPLFSVIIPTYNHLQVLPRAIDSVFSQTCGDWELIVVDDGSDDGTGSYLEAITDRRLRVVQGSHQGVSAARNAGSAAAKGTYLVFLDSDDYALPNWLARLTEAVEAEHPPLIFCGFHRISETGTTVQLPQNLGPLMRHWRGCWLAGAFAVRNDIFAEIGGYDSNLGYSENTDLGIRVVATVAERNGTAACIDQPLVVQHQWKRAARRNYDVKQLHASQVLLSRYEDLFRVSPVERFRYLSIAAVCAVRIGRHWMALRLFARAVCVRPSAAKGYARLLLACIPPLARRQWPAHAAG